jgi:lactate dehydrogenase-like 2-hydroxyacid dehydrogenase
VKNINVLLTGAVTPTVSEGLGKAFTVHHLAKAADRDAFLREHGSSIKGVAATGSHGPIGAALFDQLPNLEIVSNFGVGYDNVDVAEARRRGILVTNTPDVLTDEVADLAVGLLIATVRQIPRAEQHARSGAWRKGAFPLSPTLRGRKVGIVGLGRIGKAIATRCEAFGLPISYHGRNPQASVSYAYKGSVEELARDVDILIMVTPGGAETRQMVNAAVLEALGPDGVFINVARGSVVDEDALIDALRNKKILAAGLDVFENEPNIREEFLSIENAVILPHIASASVHTRQAMGQLVVDNLLSWFDGRGAITPVPELEGMKGTRKPS